MATIWVTIWRGGDAPGQRFGLNQEEPLEGWLPAPAGPQFVPGSFFVMKELEVGRQHSIRYGALAQQGSLWYQVIDQGGNLRSGASFNLPDDRVPGNSFFQL
jgi:hypothetical protein